MAQFDIHKIFDELSIRDTATYNSEISDHRVFSPKTIAVVNKLNQAVTFQLQGSFDPAFSEIFNIGVAFTVTANTNSWQNASVYFPYLRLTASCSISPTSGALTTYFLKVE